MAAFLRSWMGAKEPTDPSSSDRVEAPTGIVKMIDGVYKLNEPADKATVEIVFVHGLQSLDYRDAYWETWMGGRNHTEFCWPIKWLAKDFPGARIYSLSYDSTAWKQSDRGQVDGYAAAETLVQVMVEHVGIGQQGCPVVFVCHSLGGLMAKQIVIHAHKFAGFRKPKYVTFMESLSGFFYYSTPHDGSFLADYFEHIPNKGKMVRILKVINDELGRLNSSFELIERESYPGRWTHYAVGEQHKTKAPGINWSVKVVEEASARHRYDFITAPADHFGVCKPTEETSISYLALKRVLQGIGIAMNTQSLEATPVEMDLC